MCQISPKEEFIYMAQFSLTMSSFPQVSSKDILGHTRTYDLMNTNEKMALYWSKNN
jgi:hypothetical protein